MSDEQLTSMTETKSVSTVVYETGKGMINLNAKYQRDSVWNVEQKSGFINSVHKNIIPNHLIFNHDHESNTHICMDGKQRLTSLVEFKSNKFPFEWNNESLFYGEVPEEYANKKDTRVMTQLERSKFDGRSIPIVKYENLSYEDQVDIFSRIQKGKKLSPGELMMSNFSNGDTCDCFKDFCAKKKERVIRFVKLGRDRKGHVLLLSNLMYLMCTNNNSIPGKKEIDKFIDEYDSNVEKLQTLLQGFEKKLDVYFSSDLFGSSDFTKNIINNLANNILYSVLICCEEEYEVLKMKKDALAVLRKVILGTIAVCAEEKVSGKKSAGCTERVHQIFKLRKSKIEGVSKKPVVATKKQEVVTKKQEVVTKKQEVVMKQVASKKQEIPKKQAPPVSKKKEKDDEIESDTDTEEAVVVVAPKSKTFECEDEGDDEIIEDLAPTLNKKKQNGSLTRRW